MWLWSSHSHAETADIDWLWRMYLRRFDIEHTFRFLKQTLCWTCPRVRAPKQADRWTWLIIAAHTQLRLARDLAEDLRRPWEKPATEPRRLTPARAARVSEHPPDNTPAGQRTKTRPTGPGRPPGTKNKQRATGTT